MHHGGPIGLGRIREKLQRSATRIVHGTDPAVEYVGGVGHFDHRFDNRLLLLAVGIREHRGARHLRALLLRRTHHDVLYPGHDPVPCRDAPRAHDVAGALNHALHHSGDTPVAAVYHQRGARADTLGQRVDDRSRFVCQARKPRHTEGTGWQFADRHHLALHPLHITAARHHRSQHVGAHATLLHRAQPVQLTVRALRRPGVGETQSQQLLAEPLRWIAPKFGQVAQRNLGHVVGHQIGHRVHEEREALDRRGARRLARQRRERDQTRVVGADIAIAERLQWVAQHKIGAGVTICAAIEMVE